MLDQRSVVPEKYFTVDSSSFTFSLTEVYKLGIAVCVKYFRLGGWYRLKNFQHLTKTRLLYSVHGLTISRQDIGYWFSQFFPLLPPLSYVWAVSITSSIVGCSFSVMLLVCVCCFPLFINAVTSACNLPWWILMWAKRFDVFPCFACTLFRHDRQIAVPSSTISPFVSFLKPK